MRYAKALVLGSALGLAGIPAAVSAATIAQYNFDVMAGDNRSFDDISGNGHGISYWAANVAQSADNPFSISDPNPNNKSAIYLGNANGNAGLMSNITSYNLQANPNLTLEGWIKPSKIQSAIIIQLKSNDGGQSSLWVGTDNNGHAASRVYIKDQGSGGGISDANVLPLNVWSHLALTFDGVTSTLYVNGVSVGTTGNGLTLPTNLSSAFVGGYLDGQIDDVRFSDTVLAPSELGYYHSFTAPVPEPASLSLLGVAGLMMIQRKRRA